MKQEAAMEIPALRLEASHDTHLRAGWHVAVCVLWCAFAILVISLFFTALPYYYVDRQTPCTTVETCAPGQLQVEDVPYLYDLGISLDGYAFAYTLVVTFAATVHFVMAAVLFWRKSDDWMAIFLSLQMLSFGATWSNVITSLAQAFPIWYPVGRLLGAFSL